MKQVIQTLLKDEAEKRLPILKMEIDYELVTLYDALTNHDQKQIENSIRKLEQLRKELVQLEA